MNIKIDAVSLKEGVLKVEKVLQPRPTMQILSGVKVVAGPESMIKLEASDLENTVWSFVDGEVVNEGACVVMGKPFVNLVKQLKGEIFISLTDNTVTIKNNGNNYQFMTMNVGEFPNKPEIDNETYLEVPDNIFYDALQKVSFCVDADEPRPHFRGVLFDLKNNTLNIVGTDTRQLVKYTYTETEKTASMNAKFLMTIKTATLITGIKSLVAPKMFIGKNSASFVWDDHVIYSQLLSGAEDFPDYDKVVPTKTDNSATFDKTELLSALRRTGLFTSDRYNKIVITFGPERVELSAVSADVGDASESVSVEYRDVQSERLVLNFHAEMLTESIKNVQGKSVRLSYTTPTSPVLIEDVDNDKYINVFMPLKAD